MLIKKVSLLLMLSFMQLTFSANRRGDGEIIGRIPGGAIIVEEHGGGFDHNVILVGVGGKQLCSAYVKHVNKSKTVLDDLTALKIVTEIAANARLLRDSKAK